MIKEKDELPFSVSDDFGLILVSALRYAHTRATYVTRATAEYVLKNLRFVNDRYLYVMIRDLEGCEHFGHAEIDGKLWCEFRRQLVEERERRMMSKKLEEIDTFEKCVHGIDI